MLQQKQNSVNLTPKQHAQSIAENPSGAPSQSAPLGIAMPLSRKAGSPVVPIRRPQHPLKAATHRGQAW